MLTGTLVLAAAVGLWAGIHSWLASMKMKELVSRRLGASSTRAYRLAYNAFSILSLAPVALLMRATPDRWLYRLELPWAAILVGGQAVAVILMLAALLQTDTLHFAGLSQLMGRTTSTTLVTRGFYGMVRHPLYLFGLLIMWLTPFMSLNQLTVYAVLTSYLFIGGMLEERRLLREFGVAYEDYRARTPMIIPALLPRGGEGGTRGER